MEAMRWTAAVAPVEAAEPDGPAELAVRVEAAGLAAPGEPDEAAEPEEPAALAEGAVIAGPRGDELTCRPSRWF
jgi:hypothetical protein